MTYAILRRQWLTTSLAAGLAALYGTFIAYQPHLALLIAAGVLGLAAVTALAFVAPVVHLFVLVFLTTAIPYSLQHNLSTHPGLLPSDFFLLTGLLRAAVVLPHTPLESRRRITLALVILVEALVVLAAIRGWSDGRGASTVGAEARTLLGFSVAIVGMVVLMAQGAERRVMRALLVLGMFIGLLGLAQWFLHLNLSDSQDFGVRRGVSFTSNGVGQIQGGLFGFPLGVIISAAVLISGQVRSRLGFLAVALTLAVNLGSLLVTFERTLWLATAACIVILVLRAKRIRRLKTTLWLILIAAVSLGGLAAFSPRTLQTAEQRLLSIGNYQKDDSLRQRNYESRHVIQQIQRAPVFGSGLGAVVFFARPWQRVPSLTYTYTHNGYLWIAWRLGVLGAVLLFGLLGLCIAWRGPPRGDPMFAAVRGGCQVALIGLLIISVTFPPLSGFGLTSAVGLLIAICAQPRALRGGRPASAAPA